jgi:hypothetical protein
MITDSFHVESPQKTQPVVSPVVVVESQTHKHQIDATTINHPKNSNTLTLTTKENNLLGIPPASCSTTVTSESCDNLSLCEASLDSSLEVKMWQKSETESVAPSCSSIASMESSSDEVTFEFMRRFVTVLFADSVGISLELKHQFGQYARVIGIRASNKNISEFL